jgi:hypothetical protein
MIARNIRVSGESWVESASRSGQIRISVALQAWEYTSMSASGFNRAIQQFTPKDTAPPRRYRRCRPAAGA